MPNQRVNLTPAEMNEIAEHGSALKLHDQRLFQLEKNLALTDKQVERVVSDIDSEKGTRGRMNAEILKRIDGIALNADTRRDEFNAQFQDIKEIMLTEIKAVLKSTEERDSLYIKRFDGINKILWLAIGGAGLLNILLGFGIAIWAIYKK